MSNDITSLVEYGGHIELMKSWAQSLMLPMGLVKPKATTKKSTMTDQLFEEAK